MKLKFAFKKKNILVLSDKHIPYHHKDSFAYARALKKKYKPDLVVSVGDLGDFRGISFHKSDPDMESAGEELANLRKYSRELEKIFPNMIITDSNHGSLPLRRAFDMGLPQDIIRPYNEIYGVGKGWKFVDDLTLVDGDDILYFVHYITKDVAKAAAERGICVISGHVHTNFSISYRSTPRNLLWGMSVGCMIDVKSRAFAYNKTDLSRPIIGHGLIQQGLPKLLPMVLDENRSWAGYVP